VRGDRLKNRETSAGDDLAVTAATAHVLVVDDDPVVRDVLLRYLTRDGFSAEAVGDGASALAAFEARRPDLVVLDLMLPRIDGLEVFRRMRESDPRSAVLMLTARGKETERVVGLRSGADDYVAKPFSPREIVARVRAILRRLGDPRADSPVDPEPPLAFDGLEIDPRAHEVRLDGRVVELTPKEFELLHFLASHPRVAFPRTELLDQLWDVAYSGDPSTVTVHVRRLREKIEADPSAPRRLVTVWGAGYRFDP
jgi:DNA-binding response OmpR family regulator